MLAEDRVVVTWPTLLVNCPMTPGTPPKIPPGGFDELEPGAEDELAALETDADGSSPAPCVLSGGAGKASVSETEADSDALTVLSVDGSKSTGGGGKSSGEGSNGGDSEPGVAAAEDDAAGDEAVLGEMEPEDGRVKLEDTTCEADEESSLATVDKVDWDERDVVSVP